MITDRAPPATQPALFLAVKHYAAGPHPQIGCSKPTDSATSETPVDCNEGCAPLDDWYARKLLDSPPAHTLKGMRDRAIMATLHYHDIRREELCRLRVKDLHMRRDVLHFSITDKRTEMTRFVPVNPEAQRRIEDYLMLAGHKDDAEGSPVPPFEKQPHWPPRRTPLSGFDLPEHSKQISARDRHKGRGERP